MGCDDLFPVAMEVRILAGMVNKRTKHDLERRLESHGITVGALPFGVMQLLRKQPLTITEISRVMRLAPATLVPAVDALERKGLARRGCDPSDRRRTPLSLTEQGLDALTRVPLVDIDDALGRSLDAMGEKKRLELRLLLRELACLMGSDPSVVEGVIAAAQSLGNTLQRPEQHPAQAI